MTTIENNKRMPEVYTSVRREGTGPLAPLIEDARTNALVNKTTPAGTIHIKDIAFPTTRRQILLVPDTPLSATRHRG